MKTILLLTDFSTRALFAAQYAMQIAIKLEANILLCNAMEVIQSAPMAEQIAWPVANHLALKQERLADLKQIARQMSENISDGKFTPTVSCLCDFGKLSVVVANIVKNKSIDLVVMGAHKSNGLSRFLFDCHTHDVLDNIQCPVLLVPENLKFKEIRLIAYATDLTFSDSKVIKYLSEVAIACNSEIVVSHISPYGLPDIDSEKAIKHPINEFSPQDHPKILYTNIKGANIPRRLIEITGSGKADLLTLVHKQYGFFERLFHSSISKKMANSSKIPLLVLPNHFSVDMADLSNDS
jgi:nucleotide-binding universal stress UspA family protein